MRRNTRRIFPFAAGRITGAGTLFSFGYGNWRMRRLCTACQLAGQPRSAKGRKAAGGGKSGLHGNTVPDNVRRGRPQGKCHRKQTACLAQVRVKGWGKSPPRAWQHGVARQTPPGARPNRDDADRASRPAVSGPVIRVGCRRQRASAVPDEWLPRSGFGPEPYRTRLTGQLANFLFSVSRRQRRFTDISAISPLGIDIAFIDVR